MMDNRKYQIIYLALAFGTNEKLHSEIDKVYLKDRTYFYEKAKASELSKWSCFHSLSTKQEEYVRKCIGILEDTFTKPNYNEFIFDWVKKGYKVVWNYAKSNDVLSVTELFRKYLGKRQNYRLLEMQNLTSILVYLQDEGDFGTEWDHSDPQNHYMTEAFQNFITPATRDLNIKFYNKNKVHEGIANLKEKIYLDKHYSHLYTVLDHILKVEADEMGINEIIEDIPAFNVNKRRLYNRGLSKYKVLWEKFFLVNGIHKFLGETVTISKEELDFVLAFCDQQIKEVDMDEELQSFFIITCLFFTILIKEYGTTKELYLDKSQEDFHLSMRKQQEMITKRERQLEKKEATFSREKEKLKDKNSALTNEIKHLEQEVKRLNQLLDAQENYKKEVTSLREMLFTLEKEEKDPFIEHQMPIDEKAAYVNQFSLAYFGGHVNLHQKLKEWIPSIRCFSVEKSGVDLSFVNHYDAIIIDVHYLSHSFYYKLMSYMNKNEAQLYYLTRKQNIEFVIDEIYGFMAKVNKES
jgi:hypothetical protein